MPRNILQDVVTKEHRSIRRVPLPRKERNSEKVEEDILYEREEVQIEEPSPSSWRRMVLWGVAFLFLILLGIALLTGFTGAAVTVTPKAKSVAVASEFTAGRDNAAKLRFTVLPISETAEMTIPADVSKKVSERASGTIVVYNNFSEKPQRLVKNTRFETQSGLIYRISSSITVPGKTKKDGRALPGSVEAAVTADSPGVEYNIPLSDFTVPGFKTEAARFAGFYARSKTPMSGGIDGMIKVPSDAALLTARTSLRESLEKKVVKEKQSSVPQGYILFPGALITKHESPPPEPKDGSMASVKEQITGAAYLFKKDDIAKAVAAVAIPGFNNLPVEIPLLGSLVFEMKESPSGDLAQVQTLRFTLKGNVQIVWLYDVERLRIALLGKTKDDLAATLAAFPTLENVEVVIRPFWSRSFPRNPKKISIETVPVGVK